MREHSASAEDTPESPRQGDLRITREGHVTVFFHGQWIALATILAQLDDVKRRAHAERGRKW